MVKVRLVRLGKKKDPFYRIVAIDHKRKNSGKALEVLGHWHPKSDLKQVEKKKIQAWVDKGAQLSDAVKKLL